MNNRSMTSEKGVQIINECLSRQAANRPRRRLTGAKQWIVLFLLLIGAAAVYVGLYPWGFFMAGNFHPLGYWRGWGRMHSKTGGDYFLYVEISPETRTMETIKPYTFVTWKGHLCTPKGERFYLRISGEMPLHIYLNTVRQPINLSLSNWRETLPVGQQSSPSFSLWGRWGKGEIAGDDRKTLSQAFFPDGTLRTEGSNALPSQAEEVFFTLHEGSFSEWEAACSKANH